VAISSTTHAWTDLVVLQKIPEQGGGKLWSLIGMADQSAMQPLRIYAGLHCLYRELRCFARSGGSACDTMSAHVNEHSQMYWSFARRDLRHVADSDFVWRLSAECPFDQIIGCRLDFLIRPHVPETSSTSRLDVSNPAQSGHANGPAFNTISS
jgi:hypothetical protein